MSAPASDGISTSGSMNTLRNKILDEINKLRQLKRLVFEEGSHSCDIEASDIETSEICLSVDVLLIPLYCYWKEHFPDDTELEIEPYLNETIDSFPAKSSELIPRLIVRTDELDNVYITRPLQSYRELLLECYPVVMTNYVVNHPHALI